MRAMFPFYLVAPLEGIEPSTHRLEGGCSCPLSYRGLERGGAEAPPRSKGETIPEDVPQQCPQDHGFTARWDKSLTSGIGAHMSIGL